LEFDHVRGVKTKAIATLLRDQVTVAGLQEEIELCKAKKDWIGSIESIKSH
jgi:hypothetical protein